MTEGLSTVFSVGILSFLLKTISRLLFQTDSTKGWDLLKESLIKVLPTKTLLTLLRHSNDIYDITDVRFDES